MNTLDIKVISLKNVSDLSFNFFSSFCLFLSLSSYTFFSLSLLPNTYTHTHTPPNWSFIRVCHCHIKIQHVTDQIYVSLKKIFCYFTITAGSHETHVPGHPRDLASGHPSKAHYLFLEPHFGVKWT